MPDLSSLIGNVDDLIPDDQIQSIADKQYELDRIRENINKTIYDNIPDVTNSIRRAGIAMRNISNEIQRTLDKISNASSTSEQHFRTADIYIKEYYVYGYYALLGISSVLLLVLMCMACGLLCGICGKRPDGYGDDCCNKGAGARFLIL